MVKAARAVMFAVVPAELVLAIVLVSGVSVPVPLIVTAELAFVSALALELMVACRLFATARRSGADRRAAARAATHELVPEPVRRIVGFDTKGMISMFLWITRRRDGVSPGAVALPYAGEQAVMMLLMLFAMVLETVVVEVLLRALDVPVGLRAVMLVVGVYSIAVGLAVAAACITRPHVVSATELRIRYGAFFDLRIPRGLIASVRLARSYNETPMVSVKEGRLSVAVSSQTNVIVELAEPITAVRPLGRRAEVTVVRFFTDTADVALTMLQPVVQPGEQSDAESGEHSVVQSGKHDLERATTGNP